MSTTIITSPQNPRIKEAIKLRVRKGRDEQNRIIIDGVREISLALKAGVQIVELYVLDGAEFDKPAAAVLEMARTARTPIMQVAAPVMAKLAYGDRIEGFVAVATPPAAQLEDFFSRIASPAHPPSDGGAAGAAPLVAVIEGAEKPGNVGAVLRTASAAGLSGVIVASGGTDLYNPNTIRASLGAIFTTPVCATNSRAVLLALRSRHFQMLAARVDGAIGYLEANYLPPTAIILGSESRGLTEIWTGEELTSVRLPMLGAVDSLNVSVTAAVLFYEALRQRRIK